MHGGKSTGPWTAEGLERSRKARWKYGRFSEARIGERRQVVRILAPILRSTGLLPSERIDSALMLMEEMERSWTSRGYEGGLTLTLGQLFRLRRRLLEADFAMERRMEARDRNRR